MDKPRTETDKNESESSEKKSQKKSPEKSPKKFPGKKGPGKTETENSNSKKNEAVELAKTEKLEKAEKVEESKKTEQKNSDQKKVAPKVSDNYKGKGKSKDKVGSKKSSQPRNWGLVLLIVIPLSCLICCGITVVAAPLAFRSATTSTPDNSLTRLSGERYDELTDPTNRDRVSAGLPDFAQKYGDIVTTGELTTVTLTEEEMVAVYLDSVSSGTGGNASADSVGVDIEPGTMRVEIDIAQVISELSQDPDAAAQLEAFGALFARITLGTDPQTGEFTVEDFSTGNSIVDSFFGADDLRGIEQSLNQQISEADSGSGLQFRGVEFGQDELTITFVEATTP